MLRVVKTLAVVAVVGMVVTGVGASNAEAAELNLTGDLTNGDPSPYFFDTIDGTTYYSFAGALWSTTQIQPTGSGYIDSFVRIQDAGPESESLVVDGHNTSGELLNDEKPGPTFTHDVLTSDLGVVTINGEQYYQFLLDINQTGSDPLISLSGLEFCQSSKGGLSFVDTCAGSDSTAPGMGDSTLKYDMDATGDNNVLLDYSLNAGSGSGDLFVYIPTSVLPKPVNGGSSPNKYLYLWSQFGLPEPFGNNDGYEEWAFLNRNGGPDEPFNPSTVPEPTTLVMLGTGLLFGVAAIRRRNRRQPATEIS
jgi:hypothetical protein